MIICLWNEQLGYATTRKATFTLKIVLENLADFGSPEEPFLHLLATPQRLRSECWVSETTQQIDSTTVSAAQRRALHNGHHRS